MARSKTEGRLLFMVIPAAALFLSACSGMAKGPLLLHPIPPTAPDYSLTRGALLYSGPGFRITARPFDWRFVEEKFRKTGRPTLFGSEEGAFSRFIFFSVIIENDSSQSLIFNPTGATATTEGMGLDVPLEISDIYRLNRGAPDLEERGRSFTENAFDGMTVVGPGQSLERYLIFPAPKKKTKTYKLDLENIYLGSESLDLSFLYEAFRVKETE